MTEKKVSQVVLSTDIEIFITEEMMLKELVNETTGDMIIPDEIEKEKLN